MSYLKFSLFTNYSMDEAIKANQEQGCLSGADRGTAIRWSIND